MSAEARTRRYRFEPLDGSGVFLGLGALQCALLGGSLVLAVLLLSAGAPLPVAAGPVLAGAAASFGRVGGRATWEWLPLATGAAWLRARRGRRWLAPVPLLPTAERKPVPLPACLAGVDLVDIPWRGGQRIGAVRDTDRHTLTVIVRASGPQFIVQPDGEQERLLAGWGDVLNQYAVDRGLVTHVTWSDFAQHSGLDGHRRWLAEQPGVDSPGDAPASYEQLLATAAASSTSHDVTVSLTIARDRLGRHHTAGHDSDERLAGAMGGAVESLLRGLRTAGLSATDPLSPQEIRALVRTRIEPPQHRPGGGVGRLTERLGLPATAGPLAVEVAWRHVRTDGALHRTYWIEWWPRQPVGAAWLEPFLAQPGITRTVTVVLCPVPAHQSRRRIERDLVKLESDAATKEEKGRRIDALHRRSTQALLDREEELVAGYAEMAYAGLVTVTALTPDDLDAASEIVEQLAGETGMQLRLLDGRQDLAWAAALPLGLAPRSVLG